MHYLNRRRRRRRGGIEKYIPLIAAAVALCLVITGVVLLVRGLTRSGAPDEASQPVSVAAVTPDPEEAVVTPSPEEEAPVETEPTPEPTPAPTLDTSNVEYGVFTGSRSATIRVAGDVILHANIYKSYATEGGYDFTSIFDSIKGSLSSADYTVANVDGPTGGTQIRGYSEYPQFNSPPQILNALQGAGVDMLTLANNHALDTYFDGLKYTIDNVEAAGLDHVGAYRTQAEYDTPKVVDINGIKIGFTNYTVSTNNLSKSSAPEASQYGLRMTSNSDITKDIKDLRDYGAEIVVVFMHWGEEYKRTPSSNMQSMAKKIAKAGADVIVGGHPHVVLPAQWLEFTDSAGQARKTLVMYSVGNFLSDQRQQYRDSGVIFGFTVRDNAATGKAEVADPVYVPVYIWRVQKNGGGYQYKVIAAGDALQNRPSGMSDEVFSRVGAVVDEMKAAMDRTGVGTASRT